MVAFVSTRVEAVDTLGTACSRFVASSGRTRGIGRADNQTCLGSLATSTTPSGRRQGVIEILKTDAAVHRCRRCHWPHIPLRVIPPPRSIWEAAFCDSVCSVRPRHALVRRSAREVKRCRACCVHPPSSDLLITVAQREPRKWSLQELEGHARRP